MSSRPRQSSKPRRQSSGGSTSRVGLKKIKKSRKHRRSGKTATEEDPSDSEDYESSVESVDRGEIPRTAAELVEDSATTEASEATVPSSDIVPVAQELTEVVTAAHISDSQPTNKAPSDAGSTDGELPTPAGETRTDPLVQEPQLEEAEPTTGTKAALLFVKPGAVALPPLTPIHGVTGLAGQSPSINDDGTSMSWKPDEQKDLSSEMSWKPDGVSDRMGPPDLMSVDGVSYFGDTTRAGHGDPDEATMFDSSQPLASVAFAGAGGPEQLTAVDQQTHEQFDKERLPY